MYKSKKEEILPVIVRFVGAMFSDCSLNLIKTKCMGIMMAIMKCGVHGKKDRN